MLIVLRLTVFRPTTYDEYKLNLSLFTELIKVYQTSTFWQFFRLFLGNIGWFVPFGFMLPAIWQKLKSYHTIPLGFLLSLIIETSQLALSKGMFEIDDLVLNTLGTALGYLIYKIYRDFRK